jgi:predicted dehydrogenase
MSSSPARPRVAVVGARRRRQGTGPFLARFFARGGADVVAIAGTTGRTVEEARRDLARDGIEVEGYANVRLMIARELPDVLVIASPAATHDPCLTLAGDAFCHVLCEKPFVWNVLEPGECAREHAQRFATRKLHLVVAAQWPFTLDAFRALHPGVLDRVPRRFEMHLSPSRAGRVMIPDAMPHALSLLQAVIPGDDPAVDDVGSEVAERGRRALVRFAYCTSDHVCEARVHLREGEPGPKPAAYAFDDHRVDREIGEGYAMTFVADGRRVACDDPLERLVQDYLARLSSSEPPRMDPAAWPGTALVADLARAWPTDA